jgi:hypothetical protein
VHDNRRGRTGHDATLIMAAGTVDVTPFTVHVEEGTTFLFPITDNAADIVSITTPAMDAVMYLRARPSHPSHTRLGWAGRAPARRGRTE